MAHYKPTDIICNFFFFWIVNVFENNIYFIFIAFPIEEYFSEVNSFTLKIREEKVYLYIERESINSI